MNEVVDYTERLTRAAISELPDGTFDFEDWLDDDGIDLGQPVPLKVTFHKKGNQLVADWTGSSPQVKGALNCHGILYQRVCLYRGQIDPLWRHPLQ